MNSIIVMQNVLVFSSYMLKYLEMNRHDVYNTLLNAFAKVKSGYQDRAKTAKYSQLIKRVGLSTTLSTVLLLLLLF